MVLALFAATWYLLQATSTVMPVPIKKSLSLFPRELGEFRLTDTFQSSADVIQLLGVDDYIQYNYSSPTDGAVNLYVGYYQSVGVTGGYHSPKNCLPGGGWGIDSVKEITLPADVGGKQPAVTRMLIRKGSDYQVVVYWYQNRGRIIASEYWEKVYLVLDALFKGRRDGAFIRIITYAPNGDIIKADKAAQAFAVEALVQLQTYLPGARL